MTGERSLLASETMLLVGVGGRLRNRVEAEISDLGVTLRHLGALGHLSRQPELSYSDLARRAGVTSQSMRATIDQLRTLGAVEVRTRGQGRAARLDVTEDGHRLLAECRARIFRLDDDVVGHLEAPARVDLVRTLEAIARTLFLRSP